MMPPLYKGILIIVLLAWAINTFANGTPDYELARNQCRRIADHYRLVAEARDRGVTMRDLVMGLVLDANRRRQPVATVSFAVDIVLDVYLGGKNMSSSQIHSKAFANCMQASGFKSA